MGAIIVILFIYSHVTAQGQVSAHRAMTPTSWTTRRVRVPEPLPLPLGGKGGRRHPSARAVIRLMMISSSTDLLAGLNGRACSTH